MPGMSDNTMRVLDLILVIGACQEHIVYLEIKQINLLAMKVYLIFY